MTMVAQFHVLAVVYELLIVVVYIGGDTLLLQHFAIRRRWLRALIDNATHALIGGVSWAVVNELTADKHKVMEVILCLFMSAVVDLDHFIAAKSFKLQDALSLPNRPFFHATTLLIPLILSAAIFVHFWPGFLFPRLPWILAVAWLSHHLRDANRHGLWLWPFGHTPPLALWLSIFLCMILPIAVKIGLYLGESKSSVKLKIPPDDMV